jgi:hypothetical protein
LQFLLQTKITLDAFDGISYLILFSSARRFWYYQCIKGWQRHDEFYFIYLKWYDYKSDLLKIKLTSEKVAVDDDLAKWETFLPLKSYQYSRY